MRIKVLHFITVFDVGGTERQFLYLAQLLDRSRFDLRVGCLSRRGKFLKDVEGMKVPITEYGIRSLYRPQTLYRQFQLSRDIQRDRVHILHAYGFYPNVFSIPAGRLAGNCVTIASVRDTGAFSNRKQIKKVTQKAACQFADAVIANSAAVRDWLLDLGVAEHRLHVVPNGIAAPARRTPPVDFPIRRELGIEPGAPVVAVVCRLNEGKGLEDFLQSAVMVARRFPSARFLVVGDSVVNPAYKSGLEALSARLNLKDRVIFTGERHDIPQLLPEVTLQVLPSLSEGLSNSLLEAMAAGRPVVATNVGGNPEIVLDGTTGFLVPPRDPSALSGAIIRVLESPAIAERFGAAGYERVVNHFSLSAMVRRTEDLYTSLVEERMWRSAREVAA